MLANPLTKDHSPISFLCFFFFFKFRLIESVMYIIDENKVLDTMMIIIILLLYTAFEYNLDI